jgi:hypothetical protein
MESSDPLADVARLRARLGDPDLVVVDFTAAAAAAGVDGVRPYAGSWSEWCRQGLPPEGDE